MTEAHKEAAAQNAARYVESGMVVGLGTGSTAIHAVRALARMLSEGELEGVLGVPTSLQVERDARELGVPLTTLDDHRRVDLTIDGADEVDPDLELIKGGGGALLREKIVAQASDRVIIVVDQTKLSDRLGTRFALPIEILPFGFGPELAFAESLGATTARRTDDDGAPLMTDQGNWILDAKFESIQNPSALAEQFDRRAAVVAHGLFLGLATDLIVGGPDGITHTRRA